MGDSHPIFLDHHSTTPIDPLVLEAMLPFFYEEFGNPASTDHIYGLRAKEAVESARAQIAEILGCRKPSELVFTSGATEANNLALKGSFDWLMDGGRHVIISQIEHPCVLESAMYLARIGAEVDFVPVNSVGRVEPDALASMIRPDTVLISVMFANNEIGTIQPIEEIGAIAKEAGAVFHCDAAQAAGYLDIDVYRHNIDLLSLSAHKFYGPKGIGGLFVRSVEPKVKLTPLQSGGGHERGRRSGTLNVPAIIGMAKALKICHKTREKRFHELAELRDVIQRELRNEFPEIIVNGDEQNRLPHNLSLTIPGIESKALVHELRDSVAISTGAACSTAKVLPSHVLEAIGLSEGRIHQTIRIGVGSSTPGLECARRLAIGIRRVRESTLA